MTMAKRITRMWIWWEQDKYLSVILNEAKKKKKKKTLYPKKCLTARRQSLPSQDSSCQASEIPVFSTDLRTTVLFTWQVNPLVFPRLRKSCQDAASQAEVQHVWRTLYCVKEHSMEEDAGDGTKAWDFCSLYRNGKYLHIHPAPPPPW